MSSFKTKRLVETGLLLAIATVLSLYKPFVLPLGGGITIVSMLPIVLLSFRYGTKWGIIGAFAGSCIQLLTSTSTISKFFMPGDEQMVIWKALLVLIIDYIIAYTVLGFGGIFRSKFKSATVSLALGTVFALTLRYLAHTISGAIFFGSWAEWFFTKDQYHVIGSKILDVFSGGSLSFIYSIFYNGLYMIPEIILTTFAAILLGRVKYIVKKVGE